MKKLILVALISLFTFTASADPVYRGGEGTDFAPFPLSADTAVMVEGYWTGEVLDLYVIGTNFNISDKPVFLVEAIDKRENTKKVGVFYFDSEVNSFVVEFLKEELRLEVNFEVRLQNDPLSTIFDQCEKNRMATLKISFSIDDSEETVDFIKDSCL